MRGPALAALIVLAGVAWLLAQACAPAPLLAFNRCTPPPERIGPAELSRCTEDGPPCRACLYTYAEEGVSCRWQLNRSTCDGLWDLTAHECGVYSEPEAQP